MQYKKDIFPIKGINLTLTLNHKISSGIQFVDVVTDYSTNFTTCCFSMRLHPNHVD